MPAAFDQFPKVDLHVHLEGTITPRMARVIADRNNVVLSPALVGDGAHFHWPSAATPQENLVSFLKAYDEATAVMKRAEDYADITYDYLSRSAAEGCIYAELTISADHGAMVGLSYLDMLDAIAAGYARAKEETGIEVRMISSCVRHYGPAAAMKVAELTRAHPHPLVTAFGMAGDENAHAIADFAPAFDASGLAHRTAHAGEASGAETVRQAREILGIRRFGHMVRAIEDPTVMDEQVKIAAVPEVCVSSNLALKVFPDYAAHPLRKFFDAGLKVTLGSDDPSFFGTSIGREYEIARDHFGFSVAELLQITRNAIEESFADAGTRQRLLEKIAAYAA
ncbi:MAG TPA: adenosine deaminase [Patescibacteria group bacterium]|nr:adenosine deaminase [Patescibacteria group bacterium]